MLTFAHGGLRLHDLWTAWNPDPLLIGGLLFGLWWCESGFSRSPSLSGRDRWALRAGVAFLAVALLSPLDALAGALASAHMAQHLLVILLAAPLIAVARPGEAFLRATPRPLRKRFGRGRRVLGMTPARVGAIGHPVAIWLGHALGLWLWHLPGLYLAALREEGFHVAEHLTFFVGAALFWHLTLVRLRESRGIALLLVFTAAFQGTLLAVLLTFAPTPWYPIYAGTAPAWGLSALADQQLAGAIMWVPGGLLYLAVGLTLFASWVQGQNRQPQVLSPKYGAD